MKHNSYYHPKYESSKEFANDPLFKWGNVEIKRSGDVFHYVEWDKNYEILYLAPAYLDDPRDRVLIASSQLWYYPRKIEKRFFTEQSYYAQVRDETIEGERRSESSRDKYLIQDVCMLTGTKYTTELLVILLVALIVASIIGYFIFPILTVIAAIVVSVGVLSITRKIEHPEFITQKGIHPEFTRSESANQIGVIHKVNSSNKEEETNMNHDEMVKRLEKLEKVTGVFLSDDEDEIEIKHMEKTLARLRAKKADEVEGANFKKVVIERLLSSLSGEPEKK